MTIERKLLNYDNTSLKFKAETGEFEGYASVFGGTDAYGDTILPGAFAETLKSRERPVRLRWNHFGPVIGKYTEMYEDEKGLFVRGVLTPGHSLASDVRASMAHGAVDGLSIGFFLNDWSKKDGSSGRIIKSLDLVEISIVEEPADLNAKVLNIKSAVESCETLAQLEEVLRDAGFSNMAAKTVVSRAKFLGHRDDAEEKSAKEEAELMASIMYNSIARKSS
jgi:uncharacterized protein